MHISFILIPNQDFQHLKFIRKIRSTIPFKQNFHFWSQFIQNYKNSPKMPFILVKTQTKANQHIYNNNNVYTYMYINTHNIKQNPSLNRAHKHTFRSVGFDRKWNRTGPERTRQHSFPSGSRKGAHCSNMGPWRRGGGRSSCVVSGPGELENETKKEAFWLCVLWVFLKRFRS